MCLELIEIADLAAVDEEDSHEVREWVHICTDFRKWISFSVGNGKSISFWEDHWCMDGALRTRFPTVFSMCDLKEECVAAFVRVENGCKGWDLHLRQSINDWELEEVRELLMTIDDCTVNEEVADQRRWDTTGKTYLVSATYMKFAQTIRVTDFPAALVWRTETPSKVNFLVWAAVLRKIPTMDSLKRKVSASRIGVRCAAAVKRLLVTFFFIAR
ncbi:Reverse transcriptase zinc-binding domain [Macleaya cordata]|uniref:Reverse transcriptase zinc-binding domain n=1 Tax=Macleaya cordata TaxID=56857 RepID=A0A200QR45_MACCD|nr:Reverse transcriptase zinc-binding domain [Macleaya cordata]